MTLIRYSDSQSFQKSKDHVSRNFWCESVLNSMANIDSKERERVQKIELRKTCGIELWLVWLAHDSQSKVAQGRSSDFKAGLT